MDQIPQWIWDWSGSICVAISLYYLWYKRYAYWYFSNASLLPYFVLFVLLGSYMLAGLQVIYFLFGFHGLMLWWFEDGERPSARFWRHLTTPLSLMIFLYSAYVTQFTDLWAYLQFVIVAVSIMANWGTTRRYTWSWLAWLPVNVMQAFYFLNLELWALFALQFVLFSMSIKGYLEWRKDDLRLRQLASGRGMA